MELSVLENFKWHRWLTSSFFGTALVCSDWSTNHLPNFKKGRERGWEWDRPWALQTRVSSWEREGQYRQRAGKCQSKGSLKYQTEQGVCNHQWVVTGNSRFQQDWNYPSKKKKTQIITLPPLPATIKTWQLLSIRQQRYQVLRHTYLNISLVRIHLIKVYI